MTQYYVHSLQLFFLQIFIIVKDIKESWNKWETIFKQLMINIYTSNTFPFWKNVIKWYSIMSLDYLITALVTSTM